MFNILAGIRCTPTNNSKQGSPMMDNGPIVYADTDATVALQISFQKNSIKQNSIIWFFKKKIQKSISSPQSF
jgi:hypothetical protein